jgi:hypothetical protein
MQRLNYVVIASALAALAMSGWVHDEPTLAKFDRPNGGQLRMAGKYHYELLVAPASAQAREAPVTVFVTDLEGNKIPTEGATGSVAFVGSRPETTIVLRPAGGNAMKGDGTYLSTPAIDAVVSIELADRRAEQVLFTAANARDAGQ